MATTDILDHVLYLVPAGSMEGAMKGFTDLGFTVIPGGFHTDRETQNALILFEEGPYIEIIAFVKPPSEDSRHRWAKEHPGWIDWALLGPVESLVDVSIVLNNRSEGIYHYEPSAEGGRERPDGQQVKWRTTMPSSTLKPGVVPFFCTDITPRKVRVPLGVDGNTRHANGAVGVSWVRVLSNAADEVHKQLDGVLNQRVGLDSPWVLQTPEKYDTAFAIVTAPQLDRERTFLERKDRETAIYEIGIRLSGGGPRVGPHELEHGRLVFEAKSSQQV